MQMVMGELGTTHTSLDFVGIDDGFLDFIQHGDSLLHLSGVAHSCSHRVMNHEHDQMAWVGMVNNIRNVAEEIVLKKLIYR